jgi:hypothetical protein
MIKKCNICHKNFQALRSAITCSILCSRIRKAKLAKMSSKLWEYKHKIQRTIYRKLDNIKNKTRHHEWYLNNKQKVSLQHKQYNLLNRKKLLKYHVDYRLKNKVSLLRKSVKWYLKNKDNLKKIHHEYYLKNKSIILSRNKRNNRLNKEKYLLHSYEYRRNKFNTDVNFKLTCCLRSRIVRAINNNIKSKSTMNLIGCSIDQLKQHLLLQFTLGMSFDNYGKWHIDHIKPCAKFDLSKPSEQRKCFHYTNLQPLWAKENLQKSYKYNEKDLEK